MDRKYKLLLITNRDSDNVGDQFIEANDRSLIQAAFENLGLPLDALEITSRDASIVSRDYVLTGNPALIENARRLISETDVLFFGGAPLFNYLYQIFYERTAKSLEIAQEFNKPVIFSSIGIESYDEDNERCQRLKQTLNFDIVKSITTRDGFDLLQKYKSNPNLSIAKVADPAVFTKWVFKDYVKMSTSRSKKKIGVFVIRANAFKDNKINFSRNQATAMWKDLFNLLEEKGYDYEVITNGHFGDEAFMDRLIREGIVHSSKCVFNINKPEDLISHYSNYDGVITCRLHPSILSYSLGIPSVGLVWNPKVKGFYESIQYPERALDAPDLSAEKILSVLEKAMADGVQQETDFLMSIYRNIYSSLKAAFDISPEHDVFSYDELIEHLPAYPGTSSEEATKKLARKFRRTYRKYNEAFDRMAVIRGERDSARRELRNIKKSQNASFLRKVYRKLKRLLS